MNTVHVGSSILLAAACALMVAAGNVGSKAQAGPDGEQLYAKYCASCHDQVGARIPSREALNEDVSRPHPPNARFRLMMSIAYPMRGDER